LTGRLSDGEVADLLRTAQALVVTASEEFGIAAVESLASGRPVIALRSGGVLATVDEAITGAVYENADDPRALAAAVAGFDVKGVDAGACVTSAQRFSVERFQERLRGIVAETAANDGTPRKVDRPVGGLLATRVQRRGAESMRIR
jgi:glycosyltransferase involved in cell wall biosynthesis